MQTQRVVIEKPGDREALHLVTEDLPAPQGNQVRVKVQAAGVAFGDVARRMGKIPGTDFPYHPGYDVVGVVESVGPAVRDLEPGQRVAGFIARGGYARHVLCRAPKLVPVPEAASQPATTIAAVVLNYLTAYQMLRRARVSAGSVILIHGAAGGVGTAMLQLARLQDISVLGTASAGKHDQVHALGGIPIDYRSEDFVAAVRERYPDGIDAVFDPFGGKHLWRSRQCLGSNGVLVSYGIAAAVDGSPLNFPLTFGILGLTALLPGRRSVFYRVSADDAHYRDDLTHVLELLAAGQIEPVIAEVLPLEDFRRAHQLLEESAVAGKVVLRMDDAG